MPQEELHKKRENENNPYIQVEQEELFKYSDIPVPQLNKEQKTKQKEANALSQRIEKNKKKLGKLRKKMLLVDIDSDEMIAFQIERQKLLIENNELQFKEQRQRLSMTSENGPAILKLEEISLKRDISSRKKLLELYASKGLLDEKEEADYFSQQELVQKKGVRLEEIHRSYDRLLKLIDANKKLQEQKEADEAGDRDQSAEAREEAEISFIDSFLQEEYPDSSKLEYQYITGNIEECLGKVRRIQRALQMKHISEKVPQEKAAAFQEKAAFLEDYIWHVRECFLADGVDILCDSLKLYSEKPENISGRRKYLAGGYLRLLQLKEQKNTDDYSEVELRLRQVEAAIELETDKNMEIAKQITRNKPVAEQGMEREANEVRAEFQDLIGTKNRFYEKLRIYQIYEKMLEQIKDLGERACLTEFEDDLYRYIGMFQKIQEGRQKHSKKEEKAYNTLMEKMQEASVKSTGQAKSYIMMLQSLLVGDSNGSLKVPEHCEQIRCRDRDIQKSKLTGINVWDDRKDRPLFLHGPCIKDLKQGELGDCYLLAGLGAIVSVSPELIRQNMRDNGDGTVTVRFFRNMKEDGTDEPLYVTVKKTVPKNILTGKDENSRGCLWVQMIEKAYAVSGLHINKNSIKGRKSPIGYSAIEAGKMRHFVGHFMGSAETAGYNILDNKKTVQYGVEAAKLLNAIPIKKVLYNQVNKPMNRIVLEKYLMVLAEVAAEEGVSFSSIKNPEKLKESLQKYSRIIKNRADNLKGKESQASGAMKMYFASKLNETDLRQVVDALCEGIDQKVAPADETVEFYSQLELSAYNTITKALDNHEFVSIGTNKLGYIKFGKNDVTEFSGVQGGHAYTVLRTEKIKVAGRVRRYLVLFNPWAENGIGYKVDEHNNIKRHKTSKKDEGILYMELRDAVVNYVEYYEIASQRKEK